MRHRLIACLFCTVFLCLMRENART